MATKKATPVKTDRSSGVKKAAKKITTKSVPTSGAKKIAKKAAATKKVAAPVKKAAAKKVAVKKVAAKKTVAPKKATTLKKAAVAVKTVAAKKIATTKKAVPEKSIKSSFLKKGDKKTSKTIEKPALKTKKDADQLLVDAVVEGVLEVKGRNISILDLRGINNRVCDYYVICQADSSTQVNAIAGSVEVMVKKRINERPYHTEGFQNSEWILVDYVTVVVHVFQTEVREFYNLESLWADAEVTKVAFD
jgi:ribosome-associated protein